MPTQLHTEPVTCGRNDIGGQDLHRPGNVKELNEAQERASVHPAQRTFVRNQVRGIHGNLRINVACERFRIGVAGGSLIALSCNR